VNQLTTERIENRCAINARVAGKKIKQGFDALLWVKEPIITQLPIQVS
jgi:hypothetical protein